MAETVASVFGGHIAQENRPSIVCSPLRVMFAPVVAHLTAAFHVAIGSSTCRSGPANSRRQNLSGRFIDVCSALSHSPGLAGALGLGQPGRMKPAPNPHPCDRSPPRSPVMLYGWDGACL